MTKKTMCVLAMAALFGVSDGSRLANKVMKVSPRMMREYEKKHARVAMLSVATLGALSASGVADPVSWLSQEPIDHQIDFFAVASVVEAAVTLPRFGPGMTLRDGVVAGEFFGNATRFDPRLDACEDAVGRVAMLVAASTIASSIA